MNKNIIIALDFESGDQTLQFLDRLDPTLCRVKVGKELFTAAGPQLVKDIVNRKFDVFLDLKFHDIPTTVYKACISALSLNVWMLNIHLAGGLSMTEAAMKAKLDCESSTKLIGVTVLTSLSDQDCHNIYGCSRDNMLLRLKDIAIEADIDGFVCSPYDINILKDSTKIYVTPGVRFGDDKQDHHKAASPREALDLGSNYLVIGRSITGNSNPNKKLEEIISSL